MQQFKNTFVEPPLQNAADRKETRRETQTRKQRADGMKEKEKLIKRKRVNGNGQPSQLGLEYREEKLEKLMQTNERRRKRIPSVVAVR